ncbi:MAG: hypothetical protein WCP96_04925 [Methylococcaceae bacterium]
MFWHRFGALSDAAINRLNSAGEAQLKDWLISALSSPSLDAVFNEGVRH